MLTIAVAAIIALRPFYGARHETPQTPHEAPLSMLIGPALLAFGSLALGLAPAMLGADALLTSAATAVPLRNPHQTSQVTPRSTSVIFS